MSWGHGHPHIVGTAESSPTGDRDQQTTPLLAALLGQPTTGPPGAQALSPSHLPEWVAQIFKQWYKEAGKALGCYYGWWGHSLIRTQCFLGGTLGRLLAVGLRREGEALAAHSLQPAQPLAYLFYILNESNMSS